MKKYAFTLAETLICLGFIGVIATVLVSTTSKNLPDQNKILFKKVYMTASSIATELANNEALYPYIDHNDPAYKDVYCVTKNKGYYRCKGFRNTEQAIIPGSLGCKGEVRNKASMCQVIEDKNGIKNKYFVTSGEHKFIDLFASRLSLNSPPKKITKPLYGSGSNRYQFTTQDGVVWEIPEFKFGNEKFDDYAVLAIDINGLNKGPNCRDNGKNSNSCTEPDRFWMDIKYDGSVSLGKESEYPKEYKYLQDESLLKDND